MFICIFQRIVRIDTFIPGAITGFFGIVDPSDTKEEGTYGFSASVSQGMHIEMDASPSEKNVFKTFSSGGICEIEVSKIVYLMMRDTFDDNYDIKMSFVNDLPIGAGYGMSAATAMGTAFCLSKISKSTRYFAEYAYEADIMAMGGYGDVTTQSKGGAMLKLGPGLYADSIGVDCKGLKLISASIGPISTKSVLGDPTITSRINKWGAKCMGSSIRDPSIENVMRQCNMFSKKTNLMTPRIEEAVDRISNINKLSASMVMIGESLFTFSYEEDIPDVVSMMQGYGADVFISDICGCKL